MSMPYPQQPAEQPAVPGMPAQAAQPAYQGFAPGYAPVPQGVKSCGVV